VSSRSGSNGSVLAVFYKASEISESKPAAASATNEESTSASVST
jgi:hypothetical protein